MSRDLEIAVLMKDKCTESEAIKHLDKGTIVFENPDEWIDSLKDCNCYEGETIEDVRARKVPDVSIVEYDGHEYLIEYCL